LFPIFLLTIVKDKEERILVMMKMVRTNATDAGTESNSHRHGTGTHT
jgi:hypothetical protein